MLELILARQEYLLEGSSRSTRPALPPEGVTPPERYASYHPSATRHPTRALRVIPPERVICSPINGPGMGRFKLLNLGVLGYGLELRFWVVIAIIVSLTLTITLKGL